MLPSGSSSFAGPNQVRQAASILHALSAPASRCDAPVITTKQAPSKSRIQQDSSAIREVGRNRKDCDLTPMTPSVGFKNEALPPRTTQPSVGGFTTTNP